MPRFPMWRLVLDAGGLAAGDVKYELTDTGRLHVEMVVYGPPPEMVEGYLWQRPDDGHYLVSDSTGAVLAEYKRSGEFVSGPYPQGSRVAT